MTDELPDTLTVGEPARLFPVLAETSREGRALSVLLACFGSIDDLAKTLLATLGQRVGARTRVRTLTEVVLDGAPEAASRRPDGLLVVETGRRTWSALVEAKVRRSRLEPEQIEAYLKLAKANGIEARLRCGAAPPPGKDRPHSAGQRPVPLVLDMVAIGERGGGERSVRASGRSSARSRLQGQVIERAGFRALRISNKRWRNCLSRTGDAYTRKPGHGRWIIGTDPQAE